MSELTGNNIIAELESEMAVSGITISDREKKNLYALAKALGAIQEQLSSIDLYTNNGEKLTLTIDQTQATDVSFKLPKQDGTVGQALVTDGSGNLAFETVSSTISVKDEGIITVSPASSLNFKGTGVTVTNAGGGIADIDISAGGGVTSIGQGDGITATPNPIIGAGTIAVDSSVARRGAANTFTAGPQTMPVLALPEQVAAPAPIADTTQLFALDHNGFSVVHHLDGSGAEFHMARDSYLIARNTQGAPVTKGQAIYFDAGATGKVPWAKLAKGNADATMPCVGLVIDAVADNAYMRVMTRGTLTGLDTSAWIEGTLLYASPTTAGLLTSTPPSHPDLQQRMAVVTYQHANNGELYVFPNGMFGHDFGTHENTWIVGDAAAGAKTVRFRNATTGDLQWNPSAARTITLPDSDGTVALIGLTIAMSSYSMIR